MWRVKKAWISSSAIPSWWSTQPSRVTLMLKVKSPMVFSVRDPPGSNRSLRVSDGARSLPIEHSLASDHVIGATETHHHHGHVSQAAGACDTRRTGCSRRIWRTVCLASPRASPCPRCESASTSCVADWGDEGLYLARDTRCACARTDP